MNRDGELKELREGQDFLVSFREEKGKRQEAHYVLKKENFSQEGHYTIVLSSRDRAGNQMNNTSVKRNAGALPIAFAVDKTGPTVVITGAEDRGVYQSEEKKHNHRRKGQSFAPGGNGRDRRRKKRYMEKNFWKAMKGL